MSRYHHNSPEEVEPWPAPLDDVAANQRAEFQREGYACWCEDMVKRLDHLYPRWRVQYDHVDEAALALLGKTPYGEY